MPILKASLPLDFFEFERCVFIRNIRRKNLRPKSKPDISARCAYKKLKQTVPKRKPLKCAQKLGKFRAKKARYKGQKHADIKTIPLKKLLQNFRKTKVSPSEKSKINEQKRLR